MLEKRTWPRGACYLLLCVDTFIVCQLTIAKFLVQMAGHRRGGSVLSWPKQKEESYNDHIRCYHNMRVVKLLCDKSNIMNQSDWNLFDVVWWWILFFPCTYHVLEAVVNNIIGCFARV